MRDQVLPYLMYEGCAEEAMRFYVSVFPGAEVLEDPSYGKGAPGAEGSVSRAKFHRRRPDHHVCRHHGAGRVLVFSRDLAVRRVHLEGAHEMLVDRLSDGGKVFMPLDNYGFSKLFAWVADRFGVSWPAEAWGDPGRLVTRLASVGRSNGSTCVPIFSASHWLAASEWWRDGGRIPPFRNPGTVQRARQQQACRRQNAVIASTPAEPAMQQPAPRQASGAEAAGARTKSKTIWTPAIELVANQPSDDAPLTGLLTSEKISCHFDPGNAARVNGPNISM
jgi:predicted 3-demethylubiquinone-9 3-methyltransferase (glyoxalase superfamily)